MAYCELNPGKISQQNFDQNTTTFISPWAVLPQCEVRGHNLQNYISVFYLISLTITHTFRQGNLWRKCPKVYFFQQNVIFQGENIKNLKINPISVNTGQIKFKITETHHISVARGRYNNKLHRNQYVYEKLPENSKISTFLPSFSFFKMCCFHHNFLSIAPRETYYAPKKRTPLNQAILCLNWEASYYSRMSN